MEKIKVNMTPCEDVQTIHASQNDTEARQWEFELHNNGELIDTSNVTEQMFFKAYKGGTEKLLPENGSTPTTSPFLGDIRYPQGLLTNQEFTYRQSPTEEDGLAKITDIKGNTLKWNQIQPNTISRTNNGITYTYDNGKLTVTGTATSTSWWLYGGLPTMSMKANHKYLFMFGEGMEGSELTTFTWYLPNSGQNFYTDGIITINSDTDQYVQLQVSAGYTIDAVFYPQVFDLTQLFGSGNEPSTVKEFTSLFPLPYYSYNQGSLLSFNGNGIKTVGKNQFNKDTVVHGHFINGANISAVNRDLAHSDYISVLANTVYCSNTPRIGGVNKVAFYDYDKNLISFSNNALSQWTTPSNCAFVRINMREGDDTVYFNIGTDTTYESYISHTTNLPVSTYFPTGMKQAGNVYDELTPRKAITRIGVVDLGTLSFFYNSSSSFFSATIPNLVNGMTYATESPNAIVQNYEYKGGGVGWANMPDMSYGFNGQDIRIKNTAYTSSAEFVNAVRGTYMVYELATYEETSFTTASLVTENAEIPLSNEDGVLVGKCTEELSAEPGFHDAKIKLADADGECYSNKLQLHVERSPQ